MRNDGRGRVVARLYARRRAAIEQYVPFWPSVETPGHSGHNPGHSPEAINPLKNKNGHSGQGGQCAKNATDEKGGRERDAVSASALLCNLSHGPLIRYDHYDHPDQASNCAGLSRYHHQRPRWYQWYQASVL